RRVQPPLVGGLLSLMGQLLSHSHRRQLRRLGALEKPVSAVIRTRLDGRPGFLDQFLRRRILGLESREPLQGVEVALRDTSEGLQQSFRRDLLLPEDAQKVLYGALGDAKLSRELGKLIGKSAFVLSRLADEGKNLLLGQAVPDDNVAGVDVSASNDRLLARNLANRRRRPRQSGGG
ncbi:MAG: hypothetical protein ACXW3T_15465, partial [Rhodoplanes sp.]